jgi:hypothetical protein
MASGIKTMELVRIYRRVPGGWEPVNDGVGDRIWFLIRFPKQGNRNGKAECHLDKNGKLIRYTMAGAYRKAMELNGIT